MNDRKNIRLLLVDDEDTFRLAVARRLGKRGIVPEQAENGEKCLELLRNKPIDVVVLDVKMPGMDGIETLKQIKKEHPETEVILLTGHSATHEGVEGMKSGAFDYLTKPIELEHLLGKIQQAYEKIMRIKEKRKEVQFRAAMEQQMIATERLASLGTLAAGVAHEINNPLAIMKESAGWMSQLLLKKEMSGMPHKADFQMALEKIEKSIERTRRITHQLLGFVRKSDSVFSEIDVKKLTEEALDLVHIQAVKKELALVQETRENLKTIYSDPYQLRQVLVNLLTNAIHATDPGGTITVVLCSENGEVSITVRDTGQGIPKENLDKIFEPFFTTKSPGEGTGLGLFVSRGIIEKLGGRMTVESRIGHGTRVCIKLPRKTVSENHPREDVPAGSLGELGKRLSQTFSISKGDETP